MEDFEKQLALLEKGDSDLSIPKDEKKDLVFNGRIIDIEDDNSLLAAILESTLDDKKKADQLYRIFEERIGYNKDNTDSSKEAMVGAVNARNQATSNLIKLLETKFRYMNKFGGDSSLVTLNLSPRKTGIDINNIEDNLND